MEEEVETKSKDKKAAKHDSGAADLEKVTNYAEEKEIKSNANFMSVINDVKKQDEATRVRIFGCCCCKCSMIFRKQYGMSMFLFTGHYLKEILNKLYFLKQS